VQLSFATILFVCDFNRMQRCCPQARCDRPADFSWERWFDSSALVDVSPGIGFGPLGEGYVRLALIENPQRIRQATTAIKHMLRNA
jgi:aspartate/methionine/tyrosine aminotransferase